MNQLDRFISTFKTFGFILYSILKSIILFFVPKTYFYKSIKQNIILITGAGNGLGACLAVKLAKRKARLILWDIDQKGLERTVEMCREFQSDSDISIFKVDVSNRTEVFETADKIRSSIGMVDILINNAGVVSGMSLLDMPKETVERIFGVNVFGQFWTVQAFLPDMLSRNSGHIVSIASLAGIIGVGKMTDYCASKFAVIGFQEALTNEIHNLNKCGVKTLTVCPGHIATSMFAGFKLDFPLLSTLSVDYAASKIEEAILSNQIILLMPRSGYFLVYLKSFLPSEALWSLLELAGFHKIMDTFKGS